jgi:hypothetical protein
MIVIFFDPVLAGWPDVTGQLKGEAVYHPFTLLKDALDKLPARLSGKEMDDLEVAA